jgi:hypothetical protein
MITSTAQVQQDVPSASGVFCVEGATTLLEMCLMIQTGSEPWLSTWSERDDEQSDP